MKRTLQLISACVLLSSCQTQTTRITDVSDLPLKSTQVPSEKWELSPLRAHALYVLYDARNDNEAKNSVGDYFFVNWYDSQPASHVKLVFKYTQARTTRTVNTRTIEYKVPRKSAATHRERIVFNGPQRAKDGDVLTWRVELYVDGKLVDSRQSYLWD